MNSSPGESQLSQTIEILPEYFQEQEQEGGKIKRIFPLNPTKAVLHSFLQAAITYCCSEEIILESKLNFIQKMSYSHILSILNQKVLLFIFTGLNKKERIIFFQKIEISKPIMTFLNKTVNSTLKSLSKNRYKKLSKYLLKKALCIQN